MSNISFERNGAPYKAALPFMHALTAWVFFKKLCATAAGYRLKTNALLFDGMSPRCRKIKEGAASWRALELIYGYAPGSENLVTDFWLGMRNAQAVRNRFKIARELLVRAVEKRSAAAPGRPIKILSLAAGSARNVIECVRDMKQRGVPVEVLLIDHDPEALEYAKQLAYENRVDSSVYWIEGDVLRFRKLIGNLDLKPDIIEMMGLLDYLPDSRALRLLRDIYAVLPAGGFFLTCHIHENPERHFLTWVINWPMLYRSRAQLASLVITAAGRRSATEMFTEPHSIHTIAFSEKTE